MAQKSTQRRVVVVAIAAGVVVLALSALPVVRFLLYTDVVASLILVDTPRQTSYWRFTETPNGFLIQATAGRYSGWYLAAR